MNIGFAITGSFCTFEKIIEPLKDLVLKKHNVIPIVTDCVYSTDTRFGKAKDFLKKLKDITGNNVIHTIVEAEPLGYKNLIDVLVIAPCTGNTLSKLSNAESNNAVTMAAKSLMRNNKPVVIGISTNDGLGLNLNNIATLTNMKNIYFIPFGQDFPFEKPKSLMADFSKTEDTILKAMKKEQIEPLLTNFKQI